MALIPKQNNYGTCLACGEEGWLTRDHVVPRSVLRKHGVYNAPVNIQRLCQPCNNRKANTAVDYRSADEHWRLIRWLDAIGLNFITVIHTPSEFSQRAA